MQPPAQRLHRIGQLRQPAGEVNELIDLAVVDRIEQGFPAGKMTIERADAQARAPCNGLKARLRPTGREHCLGRFEQPEPVALGIRARRAACLLLGALHLVGHH